MSPPGPQGVPLLDVMLWAVLPYVVLATFVLGVVWRYRYDRFGWTTRSSQMYESRLLRVGSPLFHYGLLVVIAGHVIGLLIPEGWTEALGVSDEAYHLVSLSLGTVAGVCTLGGIALLVWRRRVTGPVFSATTRNDRLMYAVLVLTILAGLTTTLVSASAGLSGAHQADYRETVSVWFRGFWVLRPDVAAMAAAEGTFRLHALIAFALFALFPFTRLVHALSAPVGYLFRPYIVYRSRDDPTARTARTRRSRRSARYVFRSQNDTHPTTGRDSG